MGKKMTAMNGETSDDSLNLEHLSKSIGQATPEEAAQVIAKMKEHAAQLREAGEAAQAMNLDQLIGILEQVRKQIDKMAALELTHGVAPQPQEPAPPPQAAPIKPAAPVPLSVWIPEQEWEKVTSEEADNRQVFDYMSKRIVEIEAHYEGKMNQLKGVCKDWMDKVKSDMKKTEGEHNKQMAMMQGVVTQWEAESQATNTQLSSQLQQAMAQNVELQARLDLIETQSSISRIPT